MFERKPNFGSLPLSKIINEYQISSVQNANLAWTLNLPPDKMIYRNWLLTM